MAEQIARHEDAGAVPPTLPDAPAPDTAAHPYVAGPRPRVFKRWLTIDALLALVLGLAVLAVHDVGYLLRVPFWNDEAWVAVTTRFPLSDLPATTSSTPIGWSLLVRIFTVGGTQSSRLVPLAFAGIAVAIGYWFARGAGWRVRSDAILAGALAGIGVLLVPAMLERDDLKQYTADACMALLVLALTSRLERNWSRGNLTLLSVAVFGGMLFSDPVAFVGVAAFGAVCVVQLIRRAWPRLVEAAVAAVCTAAAMLGVYELFDARAANALGASTFWDGYYVPVKGGLHESISWIATMLGHLRVYFGLGPVWLAIPLVLAGLVTLFRLGRPATALAIIALLPEMIVLSAAKIYPFGDLRTSTWLIAVTVMVAATGVAGICALVRYRLQSSAAAAVAVSLVAVAAVAGFGVAAKPYVRGHTIPNEDVRDQATYVAAHAKSDDVILVNMNSNWGFAYYWKQGTPARRLTTIVRQGYVAYFPDQPRIVVASNRNLAGVTAALREALGRVQPGSCARIWLVRSHVNASEQAAWTLALASDQLTPVPVGNAGLTVIQPGGASCP